MSTNEATYNREYLEYIKELSGDEAGRRAAWKRMGCGTSFWDGEPTAFSYLPRLFSMQTRERLEHTAQMTYRILTKVIERYRADEAFRREFRFDPRVEELVLLPRACPEPLPFARVDFALNEETGAVRAIEFNTDSSSGMNENREALRALRDTEPFRRFAANHTVRDDVDQQFSGWVERFAALRAQAKVHGAAGENAASSAGGTAGVSSGGGTGGVSGVGVSSAGETAGVGGVRGASATNTQPHMALVACLDSPNPDIGELETYRDLFEQAGMPCSVFDVRQLEFDGQRLTGRTALAGPSNVVIDCIWRWCIVVDLLEHWNDIQPFIQAVRAQKVELIGSFATQIAHDKQLFAVLHRASASETAAPWLTPEERAFVRECIPFTAFLDDPALDLAAVRREPARWVVKPTDWYESKRVVAGRDCTQEEWERTLDAYEQEVTDGAVSPFIVQEFCAPYQTPAIPVRGIETDFTAAPVPYGNIVGLYLQTGTFAGAYVRQGPHAVIGSAREGLVTPVLWVD